MEASWSLCVRFEEDPEFLNRLMTIDETYLNFLRSRNRTEIDGVVFQDLTSFEFKNPLGKFSLQFFWDRRGINIIDSLKKGHIITGYYYSKLLTTIRRKIKKTPRGMLAKGVLVLQDAPGHKSRISMESIWDLGYELLEWPPYSPNLASLDYYLL